MQKKRVHESRATEAATFQRQREAAAYKMGMQEQ